MLDQFTASTRHRLFMESQPLGQPAIPTMAALQTLQPGKESSLLLIQQAVKQDDGSPNFLLFLVLYRIRDWRAANCSWRRCRDEAV